MNNLESMSTYQDNIVVDSCQYTPVYLVQDTGAIQGRSYIVAQGNFEEVKPVTNNLKRFYENSGIFESNHGNNPSNVKPRILKRKDTSKLKGNNLKLASFLIPKTIHSNVQENYHIKQSVTVNNVVIKPTVVSTNVVNTVPRFEVNRKIVKLTNFPSALKPPREKTLPKNKPKDPPANPIKNRQSHSNSHNPMKHTSVQLLKLGETYHSLNQLSDDQMKMVNQALKIFNNPEKTATLEPKYDPVTNTCFIYKVVSPKDLTVVGKNKIVINNKKEEGKKEELQEEVKKEVRKENEILESEEEAVMKAIHIESGDEPEPPVEINLVTRSGRKVKFPKPMVTVSQNTKTPHKPKKKTGAIVSCFQCSSHFNSIYRLQKHYENHPTHLPERFHSNLFHCLLAVVKSGSKEDRSNIFIKQLEQLIEKLKSLLPCLLKKIDGSEGESCTINDDIGRLFGINPGKYNLNVDALTCVKDLEGNCSHNPTETIHLKSNPRMTTPVWLGKQKDISKIEHETEDCTGINTVDKLPTARKRLCNSKQQKSQQLNTKKMKIISETVEPNLELGIEDLVNVNHNQSAINVQPKSLSILDDLDLEVENENPIQQGIFDESRSNNMLIDSTKNCVSGDGAHTRFHSTHFDIRSSPIKPSAATFRKFQINPEKLAKYDDQIIRPIELDDNHSEIPEESSLPSIPCSTDVPDLQSIFRDDLTMQLSSCKDSGGIPPDLTFDTSKDWIIEPDNDKSIESFIKSNRELEPSLLHGQELTVDNLPVGNLMDTNDQLEDSGSGLLSSQSSSVLNFLETLGNECLSYPETEIRNNPVENVDFQLDLFSFNNT